MAGFEILDLILGLIFIFFLLSIICSAAVEMVLTLLKVRAKFLEKWILKIFNDNLGKDILNHSAVKALSQNDKSTDYMHAGNFTTALLDRISFDPKKPNTIANNIDDYIKAIDTNNYGLDNDIKRQLLIYANEAKETKTTLNQINLFKKKIEAWYDSSMERVSGALKQKYARPLTAISAIIVVVSLNIDTLSIAKYLYTNPSIRLKIAEEAILTIKDTTWQNKIEKLELSQDMVSSSKDSLVAKELKEEIQTIQNSKEKIENSIPIGWKPNESITLQKISGFIVSFFAVMMGAPFWFDLMNKIANIRGTGKRPENTKTKKLKS